MILKIGDKVIVNEIKGQDKETQMLFGLIGEVVVIQKTTEDLWDFESVEIKKGIRNIRVGVSFKYSLPAKTKKYNFLHTVGNNLDENIGWFFMNEDCGWDLDCLELYNEQYKIDL